MKWITSLILALLALSLPFSAVAEIPVSMQFQGFLTDENDVPLLGEHDVTFVIYGSADGADIVWTDTQTVGIVAGAFATMLGDSENPLDANVFGGQPLWLGVTVDDGEELLPRTIISSVPYAVRSSFADNALSEEQVQGIIAEGGFLTDYTETDPTVNALAKASLQCASGQVVQYNGAAWECADYIDSDTLGNLACAANQVIKWDGGAWTCAEDVDTTIANTDVLASLTCQENEVAKWNGVAWACAPDVDTTIANTDVLASLDCAGGETALWNADNQQWECGAPLLGESDPVFSVSVAAGISAVDTANWNACFAWGDHAVAGYVTDAYADLSNGGYLDGNNTDDLVTLGMMNAFVNTPDAVVRHAGLFWMKTDAPTSMTYEDASIYCDELELGGLTNWRLPDADELRSIILGCPGTMSDGGCARTSDCPTCYNSDCNGCEAYQGPTTGIYWPEGFEGGNGYHLSSSILSENDQGASVVTVGYWFGGVRSSNIGTAGVVRCVAEPIFGESDPQFAASEAAGISASDTANWDSAYSWGNHAEAGYLTSYDESDPQFAASEAAGISASDTASWDTAYGWGNHAEAGYLTSYTESDPQFAASVAAGISASDKTNWDAAYGWGDHAAEGYITDAYANLYAEGYLDFTDDIDLVTKADVDAEIGALSADVDSRLDALSTTSVLQIPRANTTAIFDNSIGTESGYEHSSLSIGTDGYPVFAYTTTGEGNLIVVKCGNKSCTENNTQTNVTNDCFTGYLPSLAIGIDGLPIIAYWNGGYSKLEIIKCGDAACSSGNTTTQVADVSNDNPYPAITIGIDGLPILAFNKDNVLTVIHCGNTSCNSGNSTTEIVFGDNIGSPVIAIGTDGLPLVAYYYSGRTYDLGDTKCLRVAKCDDTVCSSSTQTNEVEYGATLTSVSMTIGADSLPIIAFRVVGVNGVNIIKCGDNACSSGNTISVVDSTVSLAGDISITIGKDGLPIMSYWDYSDFSDTGLKVAKCGDAACSANNSVLTLDSDGFTGYYTSITIGTDGNPIISYYEGDNRTVKLLTCANPFCLNYWTRR